MSRKKPNWAIFNSLHFSAILLNKENFYYEHMNLRSSPKVYNGYKGRDPADTIKLIKEGLKKLHLHTSYNERRITSGKMSLFSGDLKIKEIGFFTTGKGTTSLLSRASAYAELAERFSTALFYFLDFNYNDFSRYVVGLMERRFLNGFTEDFGENISFNDAKGYLEYLERRQYRNFVEEGLFDIGADAYNPILGKYVKVPIVFIDFLSGSNGLASGNTVEEAITQASCEIFERYAASEILQNNIVCPTINLESIRDERIRKYLNIFKKFNIEVILKDFSMNGKLPVLAALFINKNFETSENPIKKTFFYKMVDIGSALDLKEAILRILTERVQEFSKEKLIRYSEIDNLYDIWKKKLGNEIKKGTEDFRFFSRHYILRKDISFLEKGDVIKFKDLYSEKNDDFLKDCKTIFHICEENGWDISIIDFTHNVLRFPTVRVIIKPISVSFDPFVRKSLEIYDDEERYNFYYGIKNFYRFTVKDDWLSRREEISELIENIEEYLSLNLPFYDININRGMFRQQLNLFDVLAKLYAMLNKHRIFLIYKKMARSPSPPYILKRNPLAMKKHRKIEKTKKEKIIRRIVNSFF